eukprot:353470-Chlamydomonas_euryale.AAC.3
MRVEGEMGARETLSSSPVARMSHFGQAKTFSRSRMRTPLCMVVAGTARTCCTHDGEGGSVGARRRVRRVHARVERRGLADVALGDERLRGRPGSGQGLCSGKLEGLVARTGDAGKACAASGPRRLPRAARQGGGVRGQAWRVTSARLPWTTLCPSPVLRACRCESTRVGGHLQAARHQPLTCVCVCARDVYLQAARHQPLPCVAHERVVAGFRGDPHECAVGRDRWLDTAHAHQVVHLAAGFWRCGVWGCACVRVERGLVRGCGLRGPASPAAAPPQRCCSAVARGYGVATVMVGMAARGRDSGARMGRRGPLARKAHQDRPEFVSTLYGQIHLQIQ